MTIIQRSAFDSLEQLVQKVVQVVNGQLTTDNFQPRSVDGSKVLTARSVTADSLASGAVGTDEIADGTVADTDLASPNNAVYKQVLSVASQWTAGVPGGTKQLMGTSVGLLSSATDTNAAIHVPIIYLDNADYDVAGKTTKLRVRATLLTNGTAPGAIIDVGLYPISATGGAAGFWQATMGTVISGSNAEFHSISTSTRHQDDSGDFDFPADGYYTLGLLADANAAANFRSMVTAQLQVRNV